ncbi:MAG: CgeB family protein, partial [Terriglobales bacterium]
MEIRYFAHSWLSDWNHGNAHFLRGLASALAGRGHGVRCYEDIGAGGGGWSLAHLLTEPHGARALTQMRKAFPELDIRLYGPPAHVAVLQDLPRVTDWAAELNGAEVVIAHEWSEPKLFSWLREQRRRHGFRLLLHDTHHRACSQTAALAQLEPATCDAVIAFGESLRRIYERELGVRKAYTLHEAADTAHFCPSLGGAVQHEVVWIGNWGDEERTRELDEFLLQPAASLGRACGARTHVHGVRYPQPARARLQAAGIAHGGYLPNLMVPGCYAASRITVHIPRLYYADALAGIPTIRVFEALACGMPLVCAPWHDTEGLF